jgi:hypothetical protein
MNTIMGKRVVLFTHYLCVYIRFYINGQHVGLMIKQVSGGKSGYL